MTKSRETEELQSQRVQHLNPGDEIGSISDVINKLQSTIAGSEVDEAVARSASKLDRLGMSSSSMLSIRATALARKGKSADAIRVAMQAIEHQPAAADGYVAAGDIYSMQGRQGAAIEVLEIGLHSVPFSEQALLRERMDAAQELLERRLDFVEKLPTEVVIDTFTQLKNDMTLVECAVVSRHWRDLVLHQCRGLWRTVIFDDTSVDLPGRRLLPSINQHVYNLAVYNVNNTILKKLVDMATKHTFSSITSLNIETTPALAIYYPMLLVSLLHNKLTKLMILMKTEGVNDYLRVDDYVDYLESDDEGNLYIEDDDDHQNEEDDEVEGEPVIEFPLDTILSSCAKLEELTIMSNSLVTYQPPKTASFVGYPLAKLLIDTPHCDRILETLIPGCHRLEWITVMAALSPTIVTLIEQHCPLLQHLCTIFEPWTEGNGNISDKGKLGLYTLKYRICSTSDAQTVVPIIAKNKSTLTTLELYLGDRDAMQECMDQLSEIELVQVKVLELLSIQEIELFGDLAASIIRHCPVMETLTVNFDEASVPDDFYACFPTHSQIRSLNISSLSSQTSGLQQLFTQFAARGTNCMLKSIVFNYSAITDDVLSALASILTLQTIEIRSPYALASLTPDGVASFILKLKVQAPQLKALHFDRVPYVTDAAIGELAETNGLQTLALVRIDSISSDGVRGMADRIRSLKDITIDDCPGVDHGAIHYLQSRLSVAH